MTSAGVVTFRNSGATVISTGFENHDIVYNPNQNIVAFSGQYAGNGSYSGNVVIMTPAASTAIQILVYQTNAQQNLRQVEK